MPYIDSITVTALSKAYVNSPDSLDGAITKIINGDCGFLNFACFFTDKGIDALWTDDSPKQRSKSGTVQVRAGLEAGQVTTVNVRIIWLYNPNTQYLGALASSDVAKGTYYIVRLQTGENTYGARLPLVVCDPLVGSCK